MSKKASRAKNRYSAKPGRLRAWLTAGLLLMSAVAIAGKNILSVQLERKEARSHAEAEFVGTESVKAEELDAGASVSCLRAVKLTQGEGFVRFKVKLVDSDGVPFDEKLQQQLDERAEIEKVLDPEMASYNAFHDSVLERTNNYNLIKSKGQLALQTLVREDGSGEIASTFDSNDFIQLYDDDKPFERTLVYGKKLTAGDICPLYSDIVIPSGWTEEITTFDGYVRNEDSEYVDGILYIGNMELLGEGYKLLVSAEVVAAFDFEDPLTAFSSAEK